MWNIYRGISALADLQDSRVGLLRQLPLSDLLLSPLCLSTSYQNVKGNVHTFRQLSLTYCTRSTKLNSTEDIGAANLFFPRTPLAAVMMLFIRLKLSRVRM